MTPSPKCPKSSAKSPQWGLGVGIETARRKSAGKGIGPILGDPACHCRQTGAVQTPGKGDGRPAAQLRFRRRAARPADGGVLSRHRHSDAGRVRPVRNQHHRHQPPQSPAHRHRGKPHAQCRSEDRRRRRNPGAGSGADGRLLQQARSHRRGHQQRRLVPYGRHRRNLRRWLPENHGPQKRLARADERQKSGSPAHRSPAQAQPLSSARPCCSATNPLRCPPCSCRTST